MQRRHEKPLKRTNPSGKTVFVARWTDRHGNRTSAGTFSLRREAQDAIDAAYERERSAPLRVDTVAGYFEGRPGRPGWLDLHPRSERTNTTNAGRIRSVLDVELLGRRLGDIPLAEVERQHAVLLVNVMLREHGRAARGVQGVLRVLAAMWRDATDDGYVKTANPFLELRVRASDPRVQKPPRQIHVWSWEEMHALCAAAGPYEPMLRVLSDCGLRLGELLALERKHWHGDTLEIRQTAWRGQVLQGTKTDHGQADAGRVAPVPPALEAMLKAMPKRIDTPFLFPTARGHLWRDSNWYQMVWRPAAKAVGMQATPHEFRHSWISYMRAALIDVAHVADAAGHTVETATRVYTHAVGDSFDAMRGAVG